MKKLVVKLLQVKGDADLIVKQVRGLFNVKNEMLTHYQNRVWDRIEGFYAFSIEAICREQNSKVVSLAVSASLLIPHPEFTNNTYQVELIYQPSVPDNSKFWQVFENDKQINFFLHCIEMFTVTLFEGSDTECKDFSPKLGQEMTDGVIQLKGNKIPKGLVSLDCLFYHHDTFKKEKDEQIPTVQDAGGYERVNIGTKEDPKYVNLGKCCTPAEKERFISILLEYKDIFAWCYDDLKNFREGKFQHHTPLKPGTSLFQ